MCELVRQIINRTSCFSRLSTRTLGNCPFYRCQVNYTNRIRHWTFSMDIIFSIVNLVLCIRRKFVSQEQFHVQTIESNAKFDNTYRSLFSKCINKGYVWFDSVRTVTRCNGTCNIRELNFQTRYAKMKIVSFIWFLIDKVQTSRTPRTLPFCISIDVRKNWIINSTKRIVYITRS